MKTLLLISIIGLTGCMTPGMRQAKFEKDFPRFHILKQVLENRTKEMNRVLDEWFKESVIVRNQIKQEWIESGIWEPRFDLMIDSTSIVDLCAISQERCDSYYNKYSTDEHVIKMFERGQQFVRLQKYVEYDTLLLEEERTKINNKLERRAANRVAIGNAMSSFGKDMSRVYAPQNQQYFLPKITNCSEGYNGGFHCTGY